MDEIEIQNSVGHITIMGNVCDEKCTISLYNQTAGQLAMCPSLKLVFSVVTCQASGIKVNTRAS